MTNQPPKCSDIAAHIEQMLVEEPDATVTAITTDEAKMIARAWKSHENLRHIIRHMLTFALPHPSNPDQIVIPMTREAIKIMGEISRVHEEGKDILIDNFSLTD